MKINKSFFFIFILFYSSIALGADSGGYPGAFLRIPIGARANGMGGSYVAIVNDPTSVWWNPAGLADCQNIQILAFHSNMNFDRKLNFVSGSFESNVGHWGLHWLKFQVSNIEGRDEFGNKTGYFNDNEMALGLTYAGKISNKLSFGLTINYLNQNLFLFSSHGYTLDIGLKYHYSFFYYGFVLKNITGKLYWNTNSNATEKLPNVIRTGFGIRIPKFSSLISMDIYKVRGNRLIYSTGMEFWFLKDRFALRGGLNNNKFSAGFTLALSYQQKSFQLNYAFVPDEISVKPMNQFSLIISL